MPAVSLIPTSLHLPYHPPAENLTSSLNGAEARAFDSHLRCFSGYAVGEGGTFAVAEVVATSLLDAVIDAHLDAHAVTAGSPHVDAAYLLDAATSARRRPPGPR